MTINEFIGRITEHYKHSLSPTGQEDYVAYLQEYNERQLGQILNYVMRHCAHFPRIADIHSAALDLMLVTDRGEDGFRTHTWVATDCMLCQGEGRLSVAYHFHPDPDGGHEQRDFVQVAPYSSPKAIQYKCGKGEYAVLYRCYCSAGTTKTIPAAVPTWRGR